jgi:hypothetical protein
MLVSATSRFFSPRRSSAKMALLPRSPAAATRWRLIIFSCLGALLLALGASSIFALDDHNPIGVTGAFEGIITTGCAYNVLNHNASRQIDDMIVPGSIGKYPLKTNASVKGSVSAAPAYEANFTTQNGSTTNLALHDAPRSTISFVAGVLDVLNRLNDLDEDHRPIGDFNPVKPK